MGRRGEAFHPHAFGKAAVTGTGAPIAPQNVVVLFVNYVGGKPRAARAKKGPRP